MIPRALTLAPAIAGLILLAAPAHAQEPPPSPPPASGPVVVIIQPAPSPPPAAAPAPQPLPEAPPQPPPYAAPQPMPYPAPYVPAPYPYPPPPLRPRRSRTVFSAKLWAGPTFQRIYDVSLYGADFGLALGGQRGISGFYGTIEGMAGRTAHGLTTYQYWLGTSWEAAIDRVHLGLGVHFGYAGIERVTSNGTIGSIGLGGYALASVDLVRSEEGHALYLGARFTGNLMVEGAPGGVGIWGPSAMLGWRY